MSAFCDPKRWLEVPDLPVGSTLDQHKTFAKPTSQNPPFPGLPSDVFLLCLRYLDLATLVEIQIVNSSWRNHIVSDQLGWKERCNLLWADKGEPEG